MGREWGPLPMKANAKEASLAGRAGIQLISETRQEREKALLSDEACVRQGEGQTSQCITAAASLAARTSCLQPLTCEAYDVVTSTLNTPKAHRGLEGILSGCESEKMGSVHLERPEYRVT